MLNILIGLCGIALLGAAILLIMWPVLVLIEKVTIPRKVCQIAQAVFGIAMLLCFAYIFGDALVALIGDLP